MRLFGRVLCVTASFFLCVAAYGASAPQRLVRAIDSSQLSEVQSNVPMAARRATDLGPAAASVALPGMMLRFNLTGEQQAALTQLLRDQQDPKSNRYHQWLTPEEFAEQFGLAKPDLQKISGWLTSQGFAVTQIARGGLFIRFSGTAGEVNAAFHTRIHRMTLDGENHIANLTAPQLPVELAKVTSAITGLHNFRLTPPHRISSSTAPAPLRLSAVSPQFTYGSGIDIRHAIVPADLYTIYNENPLLTAGIDGTGIKIAVVGQSDLEPDTLAAIAAFRTAAGLKANTPAQMLYGQDPGISPLDEGETLIDLQWAGAAAPGAELVVAFGLDAFNDALTGAIDNKLAPIISISYAGCEADDQYNQSAVNSFYPIFMMANAQGQTMVAASGDEGSMSCLDAAPSVSGLFVNFPASSPLVTAVGGTQFPGDDSPLSGNSNPYWSASNGMYGGSALSYIPEQVWNGGDENGSGGGVSRYFTKPYWQSGPGVPSDSARDVPDISLYANAFWICSVDNCANGFQVAPGTQPEVFGGTSFSVPIFAGLLALVEQKTGTPIGNANPTIYALANSSYYSSVFHDVTMGSNAISCIAGTPDCPAGGIIGYAAGVGFDLATGWGSVDATNLVNSWSLVTPLVSTGGQTLSLTTLSGPASPVTQGAAIILTATVASGDASNPTTPMGTVQFLLDNVALGTTVPLNAGTATYSLDTTTVREGHTVQAAYSGDATFAGSRNAFAITVTPTGASTPSTITLIGTPQAGVQGTLFTFTATVASGSSSNATTPTGSVQISNGNGNGGCIAVLLYRGMAACTFDSTYDIFGSGPYTMLGTYSGDSNFAGSQTSFVFDILPPVPDFTLTLPTTTATAQSGSSATIPMTIASLNGFTGNVQFSINFANAVFTPNPVAISPSATWTTSLALHAYTQTAASRPASTPRFPVGSGIALAGILMLVLPKRRRLAGLLVAIISTGILVASGCGGSTSPAPPPPPTRTPIAPGTYPITITATGTSGTTTVTHTAAITFIVQ
jgi:Pro-kumamolisin, activation domain/Bacterial Ig-like domain (group 3)